MKCLIMHHFIWIFTVCQTGLDARNSEYDQEIQQSQTAYNPMQGFANIKGADQPWHQGSLISAFIICL